MKPRGFTLVEVLLALTLGSLVVLVAHTLFRAVTDGSQRLSEVTATLARSSNARRWLIEAFGSLDIGTGGSGGFSGRPDGVEFSTWLLGERGWFVRRRVALQVMNGALVANLGADSLVLADSVAQVRFEYLLDPGPAAVWVWEWLSSVSAPHAVRLRVERSEQVDTLILLVGPRG